LNDDRRCLVVDGHAVVRRGVRDLIGSSFQVEEAATWREALDTMTATGSFEVAVIELDGRTSANGEQGGTKAIKALHRASPSTGIVALAHRAERHAANEAIEAGASAYVAKSSPPEALMDAVAAAADSTKFVDPAANASSHGTLTRRQRQILQLLADGHSTADIAHRLHVSAETVRTHTKATLARLDARDRAHAVAIALRGGLID
jgi:DNA-binding NarL/FixJ family response regulator